MKNDINFLRFLAVHSSVLPFNGSMADAQMREWPANVVLDHVRDFVAESRRDHRSEISLYVHIPFCQDPCSFCHCARIKLLSQQQLERYLNLLVQEADTWAEPFQGMPFQSLSFGGGTPSILSESQIYNIFSQIHKRFRFLPKAQINFEATPATLTASKVRVLKQAGVTRLTLGIQSMDPIVLQGTGRVQTWAQIDSCVRAIRKNKIPILNIDLMAGLPGQTAVSFLRDLKRILKWQPDILHINPFGSVESVQAYSKHRDISYREMALTRISMIKEARNILLKEGYFTDNGNSYSRVKFAESAQEVSITQKSGSILGLGSSARSRLSGRAIWQAMYGAGAIEKINYRGVVSDGQSRMAEYLIYNLLRADGVSKEVFFSLFGIQLEDVFKCELSILMASKIIVWKRGRFIYNGDWSGLSLFEYFVHTKRFYGERLLMCLRKTFEGAYHPDKDYSYHSEGLPAKIMDDSFTALLSQM